MQGQWKLFWGQCKVREKSGNFLGSNEWQPCMNIYFIFPKCHFDATFLFNANFFFQNANALYKMPHLSNLALKNAIWHRCDSKDLGFFRENKKARITSGLFRIFLSQNPRNSRGTFFAEVIFFSEVIFFLPFFLLEVQRTWHHRENFLKKSIIDTFLKAAWSWSDFFLSPFTSSAKILNKRSIGVRARPNLGGRHLFARKKFSFCPKNFPTWGAETLFARTFCPKIVYLLHKFWQFCPKKNFLGGLPPPPPPPWLVRLWKEEYNVD